jgi:hypothetical protein
MSTAIYIRISFPKGQKTDAASWEQGGLMPQCAFGLVLVGLPGVMLSELGHLPLLSRWWLWRAPLLGAVATPLVLALVAGVGEGRARCQISPGLALPPAHAITAAR